MSYILEKELVYKIIGCALTVHKIIGHGFREKTYERALCIEFSRKRINYSQQSTYSIHYAGNVIDEFTPDLEVNNRIIVELKTVESITDEHRGQLLNYLRVSGKKVGVLINFKHPRLKWERLVLDPDRKTRMIPKH